MYCIAFALITYLYYALEMAQEKEKKTPSLSRICAPKLGDECTHSIFSLFIHRQLMLLFLYFAIFGFYYCRYYYEYYFILLPAAIQSQYEI